MLKSSLVRVRLDLDHSRMDVFTATVRSTNNAPNPSTLPGTVRAMHAQFVCARRHIIYGIDVQSARTRRRRCLCVVFRVHLYRKFVLIATANLFHMFCWCCLRPRIAIAARRAHLVVGHTYGGEMVGWLAVLMVVVIMTYIRCTYGERPMCVYVRAVCVCVYKVCTQQLK